MLLELIPIMSVFAVGQTDCLQCPVGTYQDKEGQISCKNCTEDMYQDLEAQLSCKDCSKYIECTNPNRTEYHSKMYSKYDLLLII